MIRLPCICRAGWIPALAFLCVSSPVRAETNTFTVAAYNVQNWLRMERWGKPDMPKPYTQKEAVWSVIESVRPDVLGLSEIGTRDDLEGLAEGLRERGLDYPHREWIEAGDPVRHVAVLSRFPITGRFSVTDARYREGGRTHRFQRGILDVELRVNDGYSFRVIVVHLKSKRATEQGDEATMRIEEARILRRHIDNALAADPQVNLIVMGDLNDTEESDSTRTVRGSGVTQLFELRPLDSLGREGTHFWRAKAEFSRIDYLLLSAGMNDEYVTGSAKIVDVPTWEKASDHRALHARFVAMERGASPVTVAPTAKQEGPGTPHAITPDGGFWIVVAVVLTLNIIVVAFVVYRVRSKRR